MGNVLEFEFTKVLKRRLYYISFISIVIFLLIYFAGFENFDFSKFFDRRIGKGNFIKMFGVVVNWSSYVNGYLFAILCIAYSFHLLLPIFVSLTGGYSIAGESKEGTLRAMLSRPISRTNLLTAKFLVTLLHSFFLIIFLFGVTLLIGITIYGSGDMLMFPSYLLENKTTFVMPKGEVLIRYLLCIFTTYANIFPLICLSILISAILENPTAAVVSNIITYFILTIISSIPYYENLKPYIFTTYMDSWKNLFARGSLMQLNWEYMTEASLKLFLFGFIFLVSALIFFRMRDIKS